MLKFHEYARKQEFKKDPIGRYGKYKVLIVDGEAVRNSSSAAEEFGLSGDHIFYSFIPEHEIWIEDSVSESGRQVLIASELYFLRLVAGGLSKDAAYDRMLAKDKDYRDSVCQSKKNPSAINEKAHSKVYIRRFGHIQDEDIDVWLVNAKKVRDKYKCDWLEAGHGFCYRFVPNNEIWLESGEHPDEFPYLLLHEYVERVLMKYYKKKYHEAHEIASKVEFSMREKGGFSKEDALGLTRKKVEDLVDAER